MCSAAAGIMAGSMAVGAYSASKQQGAMNKANAYNAMMADRNSQIADFNAKDSLARGKEAEKMHRLDVSKIKGSQRASYGASGVVVDSDSAMDVLQDTAKFGELDALTIRRNAARESFGYKTQAANYTGQSAMFKSQIRSPWEAASMSLLGSGSSYGAMYAMRS